MIVQGRTSVEADPVSMRRSTRFRRLFVAFLVVVTLAIVVRFARAGGTEGFAEAQDRAPSATGCIR